MKTLRCAIYTRTSSDEGLDQSFNSLDAQHEACAAYILSQAGEGWAHVKDIYEDGGFSGGGMERPALNRLLAAVNAGRVDVIVVYKVDRLTRSLADFARIVEILDRAGASFVSVTQAFNTTTSMGRLTLNVLLSFAQFEREVTGERIRDKIAASKAKGLWMGGNPPLGYDVRDRALMVNEAEAAIVRDIYARYLAVRSVFDLRDGLARDGVRSKSWISRAGRSMGGRGFSHGALYHILANRLYLGEIVHRGKAHPGQHEAIVAPGLFEAVALKLKAGAPPAPKLKSKGHAPALLGKLFDDRDAPMTSAHANKRGRRYFYYVSTAVNARKQRGSLARVSAPRLEQAVLALLAPLLAPHWRSEEAAPKRALAALQRLTLSADRLVLELAPDAMDAWAMNDASNVQIERSETHWRIEAPLALRRPPLARRGLMGAGAASAAPYVDRALVRAIAMARRWSQQLASGEIGSLAELARQERISSVYAGQLLPLAFLAPDLIEVLLDGRQPAALTLAALIERPLPLTWRAQRALFSQFA